MVVIDSHTHVWGESTDEHPWKDESRINKVKDFPVGDVYTAETLLSDMEEANVDKAVLVNYPIYGKDDNWYTVKMAEKHSEFIGIVNLDPAMGYANQRLKNYIQKDDIHGIRLSVGECRREWFDRILENTEFWQTMDDMDGLVQIISSPENSTYVEELVSTYPDLQYAIDHFCLIDATMTPNNECFNVLERLSANENVAVKVSAAPVLSERDYPFEDLHSMLNWFLSHYGRERLWWGSDHPYVSTEMDSYEKNIQWLWEVESLSDNDIKWLVGQSLDKTLGVT